MTPYWQDPHLTLYGGDCRAVLAELPAESVHCVVTSPPYWGLRDYGVGGQLGLEPTPDEYVTNMVAVFREVRRVLRADGTLWLNLGDSYAGSGKGPSNDSPLVRPQRGMSNVAAAPNRWLSVPDGVKGKDLVGIPWMVAFALRADGWYLRSDIIWAKPNPMPESVTDRPTKAHEYLFLLTKSARYYYDSDAVREAYETADRPGPRRSYPSGMASSHSLDGGHVEMAGPFTGLPLNPAGRNLRSVWNIATEPYPGAHFATFPRKLVEPCVKAGTSEKGVCPECGAPWERVVERGELVRDDGSPARLVEPIKRDGSLSAWSRPGGKVETVVPNSHRETTMLGWQPTCSCVTPLRPVPAVVLDPFAGSGTTLLVAQSLGRRGIGIDLNPDYLAQALDRNRQVPLDLGA